MDLSRTSKKIVVAACLLTFSGLAVGQTGMNPDDDEEEELVVERPVDLELRLIDVERVPTDDSRLIARFRVLDGPYRGAFFSLAYETGRPVRVRSWNVHEPSGYKRIGGAREYEPAIGQWNELLRPDSDREPVETLFLATTQFDLNEDEEDRRWHFTTIDALNSIWSYDRLDTTGSQLGAHPARLPER